MSLTTRLRQFFAPPVFPGDDLKTRRAHLLTLVINTIIIGIPLIIVGNVLGGRTPIAVQLFNLAFWLAFLAWRWRLRRGQVSSVSVSVILLTLIYLTAVLASLGTIRSPTTLAYVLIVMTAGLLFDRRELIITIGLSLLVVAGLIGAENAGWLPPPDYQVTFTQWVTIAVILTLGGSLTYYSLTTIRQALHRADQELAERIRAEERLRQSNAALQLRNEELDAFAHTVAHDLKNPLGIMVGYADLLIDGYADLPQDTVKKSLRTLSEKGRKASTIIEALLLFASVRQQEAPITPIDTARLIDEALQRLIEEIRATGAVINQPDRSTWPVALGYAPWVEEIWTNYLGNAIKYGGRPPQIELSATRQPDGLLRFNVHDNGPGLTPEQQALLFVPFERLGQDDANGHGLGLSITRRIADKLGGQVGVESEPGRGSTFYFTLPAAVSDPA